MGYFFAANIARSKQLKDLSAIMMQVTNNKVVLKNIGADIVKSKLETLRAFSLDALVFFSQHEAALN